MWMIVKVMIGGLITSLRSVQLHAQAIISKIIQLPEIDVLRYVQHHSTMVTLSLANVLIIAMEESSEIIMLVLLVIVLLSVLEDISDYLLEQELVFRHALPKHGDNMPPIHAHLILPIVIILNMEITIPGYVLRRELAPWQDSLTMEIDYASLIVPLEPMLIMLLCIVRVDVQVHILLILESINVFKSAKLKISMLMFLVETYVYLAACRLVPLHLETIPQKHVFLFVQIILIHIQMLLRRNVCTIVLLACTRMIYQFPLTKDVLISVSVLIGVIIRQDLVYV